jgi:microcystin-dependent protein
MADTLTPNYNWVKPEVGASPTTWGAKQNNVFDQIDAQVHANEMAGSPVGSGAIWFAATPPTNWLICDGSSLDTTTYATLFAVIGYTWGGSGANFNLPPLAQKFPLGAGPNPLGTIAGSFAVALATANLPAHAHPIVDVVHAHSIEQTPHNHGDPTHTHGASQPAHSHTYAGPVTGVGGLSAGGSFAGIQSETTSAAQPPITVNASATGIQAAYANINGNATDPSGTGLSTTQNTGSGAAFNVVPPFAAVNFIIRYQ